MKAAQTNLKEYPPATTAAQNFHHLRQRFLEFVWRRHIYLWINVYDDPGGCRKCRKTLVMQTTIGTLSARATARCSFDMPMTPALAPMTRITQDGAPDVKPYNVGLRYRAWPTRCGFCL